jgi:hypothetical protein
MINRFADILHEYKQATLVMESETEVSITWAFPMMDRLMGSVESFERTGIWGDEAVQQSLQLSWETLRKYYRHMNQSVYYVCLFLNPQVKTSYVEHHWEPDWLPDAEDALQRAWERYKQVELPPPSEGRPPPQHRAEKKRPTPSNPFRQEVEQQAHAAIPVDELEQYRQLPPLSEEIWASRFESNALLWWRESGQHLFPRLALMAKDFFSAQGISSIVATAFHSWAILRHITLASTSPSERAFSAAGNAQGPRQAAMSQETLQALVTLRAWWKPGVLGFDSVLETYRQHLENGGAPLVVEEEEEV